MLMEIVHVYLDYLTFHFSITVFLDHLSFCEGLAIHVHTISTITKLLLHNNVYTMLVLIVSLDVIEEYTIDTVQLI